ncbi:MAG: polyprenyl synthetase family protein, partial [Patescibacteria group bacterium]
MKTDILPDIFRNYKSTIDNFLTQWLTRKRPIWKRVNHWGTDVDDRLLKLVTAGKTIRGGLVLFGNELFSPQQADAVRVAASLELTHAALLIHDDIMDLDETRRGQPAFYVQYRDILNIKGHLTPINGGIALAMCAADLAIFASQELLGTVDLPPSVKTKLYKYFSEELVFVTLGQMQDVYSSGIFKKINQKEILKTYRYKPGRYTFALPLGIGAIQAKQP